MPSVLLFSGLPLDVKEQDLAELLTAEPTRLAASSINVTALYNSTGTFLGTFLVEVGGDADAERVRRQFSGQVIDGSQTVNVHHVLASTLPHPSTVQPAAPRAIIPPFGAGPSTVTTQPAPRAVKGKVTKSMPRAVVAKEDSRAPGLKLLSRLGKGGKAGEKERQRLLLEKQRKALAKAHPGEALLSRLAKSPKSSPVAKGKAAAAVKGKKAGAKGADKVSRAKKSNAMDVDSGPKQKPKAKQEAKPQQQKPKPKTQAELDEEMKAYERQRRFAAA